MKCRLSIILGAALAALILPLPAAADDFFDGGNSGFYETREEEREFFGKREKEPVIPGSENADAEAGKATALGGYKWFFSLGASGNYDFAWGWNGPVVSLGGQWSPVKHFGIGVRVGIIPFRYSVNMSGPVGNNYDFSKEHLTVADGPVNPDTYSYYEFFLGQDFPLTSGEIHLSYFFSDRGLYGFYAGVDFGAMINFNDPVPYINNRTEQPIEHIPTGEPSTYLPVFGSNFCGQVSPVFGYKLIFGGFTVDLKVGYTFSTWPLFGGIRLAPTIGYSF